MLIENYSNVTIELKNSTCDPRYREEIFFDSKTAALAMTNHLVEDYFAGGNLSCTSSDGALVDSVLLQFLAWDFVGYNDRSCQDWVVREGYRYFRQGANNLDGIIRRGNYDKEYVDDVTQNAIYQGLAIKVLKCQTKEDLQVLCRQYPKIIEMVKLRHKCFTSEYGRGNPLDCILQELRANYSS